MPTNTFHKYADETKRVVANFAALVTQYGDPLLSAVVTRSGAAATSVVGGSTLTTATTVSARVSGGTPAAVPPANTEDDLLDVVTVVATTVGGLVWQANLGLRMRQAGAVSTSYSKYAAEVRPYLFDLSAAVQAPYTDPLVATPSTPVVAQISGPDSALVLGTPAIVAVSGLAAAGVQVLVSAGTVGGTYVIGCLVYTTAGQRLRTNLSITIRAADAL